ncbi:MAG TPA: DMT family transporter [Woeseiaceae bacterium]|nr:DMT family transporter [Woeseiaceae bacterium]
MSLNTAAAKGQAAGLSVRIALGASLVMFLWAVCFPLISVGLANSPPMTFAALRAALSGAVLVVAANLLGRPPIADRSQWGAVVLVGLTATSLGFFGMFYGGGRVSPGLATVIANTQPLIAAVLAWAILKEQLSVVQRAGLAAGFGGIVLIGAPSLSGTSSQLTGIIFILVAAVAIAISNVVLKRLAGHVDILRAMGWQLLIGALPLTMLAIAIEDVGSVRWSWQFTLNLLVLSVLGTSAAFAMWFALLRRATLSQLNVFTFLTPIFGLAMGVAFFAERLQTVEAAGIALSLLGIYGVSRPNKLAALPLVPRE